MYIHIYRYTEAIIRKHKKRINVGFRNFGFELGSLGFRLAIFPLRLEKVQAIVPVVSIAVASWGYFIRS